MSDGHGQDDTRGDKQGRKHRALFPVFPRPDSPTPRVLMRTRILERAQRIEMPLTAEGLEREFKRLQGQILAGPMPQLDIGTFAVVQGPGEGTIRAWAWRPESFAPVHEVWAAFHVDIPQVPMPKHARGLLRPSSTYAERGIRYHYFPVQFGNQNPYDPVTIDAFVEYALAHTPSAENCANACLTVFLAAESQAGSVGDAPQIAGALRRGRYSIHYLDENGPVLGTAWHPDDYAAQESWMLVTGDNVPGYATFPRPGADNQDVKLHFSWEGDAGLLDDFLSWNLIPSNVPREIIHHVLRKDPRYQ